MMELGSGQDARVLYASIHLSESRQRLDETYPRMKKRAVL